MPVVSNTSPIWNLASIKKLYLIHEQFSDVLIPDEVLAELRVGYDYPAMVEIQRALDEKWLKVEHLNNQHLKQSLMLELDSGEAAAIALAIELGIPHILIDEADGRATAKTMGLQPTGVLGILLRAKNEGKIISLLDELLKLRHESGFFIAEALFQRILREAGEI